ncbi:MAG TPA: alanine dehydrogenase [Nitrospirae bacterium]|nr:alanine dehydrogenase [bacterium BMS3Abin06]HDH13534.1 alanine dehydrogenase [Nitrospirota bacterium]HDZ01026.1 alanine dehydrogenase [Nitrospirota bacterium]
MIIGIPKEIKEHEYRVGMAPAGVRELVKEGHRIIVERSAGSGSGFSDEDYQQAGAGIADKVRLFRDSELIVKVKEPLPPEYGLFQEGQAVFTFLHLASAPELVKMLLKRNITGLAYETLELNGALPLLRPMSEIAGKMAPVMAAYYLQKIHGGEGILVTGAGGVSPARVLILGAGTVGMSALQVACGMGADVTVINRGEEKLRQIDKIYEGKVKTVISTPENIEAEAVNADVLIGAVLITGARAPKLVSRELVSGMKKGSVIVDVSVDQGGCVETTKPTTHTNPVYSVDGVIHYTVANMPGAYPRTSTLALTNRTIEYIKMLAKIGIKNVAENTPLKTALNTYKGKIMHSAVADSFQENR